MSENEKEAEITTEAKKAAMQALLDGLSQEDKALLLQQLEDKTPDNKKEEWIFTNCTPTAVTISDLGVKSPSGIFDAETFKPWESKDLSQVYQLRDLRNSRYLKRALLATVGPSGALLVRGVIPEGELEDLKRSKIGALASIANRHAGSTSSFRDDTPNEYQTKLEKLYEKDDEEDRRTRLR